jgi:hypothetical protein
MVSQEILDKAWTRHVFTFLSIVLSCRWRTFSFKHDELRIHPTELMCSQSPEIRLDRFDIFMPRGDGSIIGLSRASSLAACLRLD